MWLIPDRTKTTDMMINKEIRTKKQTLGVTIFLLSMFGEFSRGVYYLILFCACGVCVLCDVVSVRA